MSAWSSLLVLGPIEGACLVPAGGAIDKLSFLSSLLDLWPEIGACLLNECGA